MPHPCRTQIGLSLLYLAVDSSSPDVRRAVVKALERDTTKQPQLINRIVRESLTASFMRDKAKVVVGEEQEVLAHKQGRLIAFLGSVAAIGKDVDLVVRENLMAELVVLGHHAAICEAFSAFSFLCGAGRAD